MFRETEDLEIEGKGASIVVRAVGEGRDLLEECCSPGHVFSPWTGLFNGGVSDSSRLKILPKKYPVHKCQFVEEDL